jgi:Fe-S-cluster containining protein
MEAEFNWDAFTLAVENTAAALLGGSPGDEELIQAARAVQELAERELARHHQHGELVACGPGCSHCCVLNVAVLTPEAAAVADYLQRKLDAPELDRMRQRIDRLYSDIRWCSDDERITRMRSCAFVDGSGRCGIYPVRPLLCRALTSTDPETCRQAVLLHVIDESPPILLNLFQANLFRQSFVALAKALAAAGLDDRSRELTGAVKSLLDRPGSSLPPDTAH